MDCAVKLTTFRAESSTGPDVNGHDRRRPIAVRQDLTHPLRSQHSPESVLRVDVAVDPPDALTEVGSTLLAVARKFGGGGGPEPVAHGSLAVDVRGDRVSGRVFWQQRADDEDRGDGCQEPAEATAGDPVLLFVAFSHGRRQTLAVMLESPGRHLHRGETPPMEPFQLDFPIPEIGAEPGDWLCRVNDPSAPIRVVKAVDRARITELIRRRPHLNRLFQFLGRVALSDPPPPVQHRHLQILE